MTGCPRKARIVALLDRGVEGVEVGVEDGRGRSDTNICSHRGRDGYKLARPALGHSLRKHGADALALPLAANPLVLDQRRLAAHARPLQHAARRHVARFETAAHAVQLDLVEGDVEQGDRRLGGVAASLVVGVDDVPDLALLVVDAARMRTASPIVSPVSRSSTARLSPSPSAASVPSVSLRARAARTSSGLRGPTTASA